MTWAPAIVPEARLRRVPEARLRRVPEARLRRVPEARLRRVPEARLRRDAGVTFVERDARERLTIAVKSKPIIQH
ncbi:MAG: hypothetical protein F9K29_17155 [Hyphomicrobiaceae bacterium]|nr:MAG: hypothetical protein F9K29_17155 [Hyphomicrobiaceae bacterium]